ncbi:MAG TPA: hypothetical protein VEB19_05460 [Gemmatimonadaceae bacterium]|nr:hypothetical protein [Gemmatimonadaceae bacterium]
MLLMNVMLLFAALGLTLISARRKLRATRTLAIGAVIALFAVLSSASLGILLLPLAAAFLAFGAAQFDRSTRGLQAPR